MVTGRTEQRSSVDLRAARKSSHRSSVTVWLNRDSVPKTPEKHTIDFHFLPWSGVRTQKKLPEIAKIVRKKKK